MSIYIGNDNDFEDRLKALEAENEYHRMVHEIDHMSDLHVYSSFYKLSMKIDNYFKVKVWLDSSIGQSTVIQQLDKKRPKLSNLNQTQNRRRYINFESGAHFICSLNLNSPELTVFIAFRMNSIASENQSFFNSIIGNTNNRNTAKLITFYKTHSGLGLLISKAHVGSYVAVANDGSSLIPKPDSKFPSSKSNCTILNKWHVISVTRSNKGNNQSSCWSNGEKLMTFTTGNIKGSDHCFIGDLGKIPGWIKTHLTGCIGEIIGYYRTITDKETSYIHQYLMTKWT